MRFKRIKFDGAEIRLEWSEETGREDESHEHVLISKDRPAAEFSDVLGLLVDPVLELLELPEEYAGGMTVRGVSFSYSKDDRMGAVVTCLKELHEANAPLVLNTPHLQEPDVDDPNPQLSPAMSRVLHELQQQAVRYVGGHREQRDMFDEEWDQGPAAYRREPALVE